MGGIFGALARIYLVVQPIDRSVCGSLEAASRKRLASTGSSVAFTGPLMMSALSHSGTVSCEKKEKVLYFTTFSRRKLEDFDYVPTGVTYCLLFLESFYLIAPAPQRGS